MQNDMGDNPINEQQIGKLRNPELLKQKRARIN